MNPLDDITVVSLEQAVAAPFTTRQLADLGARVIKVERPGPGDCGEHTGTAGGQAGLDEGTSREVHGPLNEPAPAR